ncbi:MAG: hypothetical protein RIQ43_284 [Pseudomonadota bacterium]
MNPGSGLSDTQASVRKTFLLGVGAQKCGSTWLSQYLRRHPQADMGFTKEYHIFDALHLKNPEIIRKRLQARIQAVHGPGAMPTANDLALLRFLGDTEQYFDYFQQRLAPDNIVLTGDVTPSYAALPPAVFRNIRQAIAQRGLRPAVLYLMRDPVERCLSLARHKLKQSGLPADADREAAYLKQVFAQEAFVLRTRYDLTLQALEAVFHPEDRMFLLYEEFFEAACIDALAAFLGIRPVPADFGTPVNVSRTGNVIARDLRQQIFNHYLPVYRDMAIRYGHDRLSHCWPSYRDFAGNGLD